MSVATAARTSRAGLVGQLLAGVGGVAMAVSVFFTWYSLNVADVLRGPSSQLPPVFRGRLAGFLGPEGGLTFTWSGWFSLHEIRFVLLLVGLVVFLSSIAFPPAGPVRAMPVLAGGLLAIGLAVYRIASPPGTLHFLLGSFRVLSPSSASAVVSHFVHVELGAWLAVIGGALVAVGAFVQGRSGVS